MTEVTTLRPGWRTKLVIFIAAFLGFGAWGYYDATIAYPARGLKVASIRELEYLQVAQRIRGRLDPAELSVPDPKDQIDLLRRGKDRLGELDKTKLVWLEALENAWRLDASRTTYNNSDRAPAQRLKELDAEWKGVTALPKAVDAFDIFVQWLIFFGCMTLAGLALLVVVMVKRRPFRFDRETLSLTLPKVTAVDLVIRGLLHVLRVPFFILRYMPGNKMRDLFKIENQRIPAPGGQQITPADLAEVDKTRWSRYWVKLHLKPSHPTLGGKAVSIDLYRRKEIEGWILEMEKAAFPEAAAQAVPVQTTKVTGA